MTLPKELSGAEAQFTACLLVYFRGNVHKITKEERDADSVDANLGLFNGKRFVFSETDKASNPAFVHFKVRCYGMKSQRLIPLRITANLPRAKLRKELLFSPVPPVPQYIRDVYSSLEVSSGDTRPRHAFESAHVLGGSLDGIANALQELARPETAPNLDPNLFVRALLYTYYMLGCTGSIRFSPKFEDGCFDGIIENALFLKSGGVYAAVETQVEAVPSIFLKYTGQLPKGRQAGAVYDQLYLVVKRIREAISRGAPYARSFFPETITVPEVKVQIRMDWKDRIFFNTPTWLYVAMKYILGPILDLAKRRGFSGIGVKWWDGDAQRIWNQFRTGESFYEADWTRQDQTELAQPLAFNLNAFIMFFDPSDVENYTIVKWFLRRLSEECVVHILQWPDGFWRAVVGMNFSGLLTTADTNTKFSIEGSVYYHLWKMKQARACGNVELADAIASTLKAHAQTVRMPLNQVDRHLASKALWHALFAGDDNIGCWSGILAKHCSLYELRTILITHWKVQVNFKSCSTSKSFLSRIDPSSGDLIKREWRPEGTNEVYERPEGIVFLKHCFVKRMYHGQEIVVPYRDTSEIWHRAGLSISDLNDRFLAIIRLHGLMQGCLGTNFGMYNFLAKFADTLRDKLRAEFSPISDYYEQLLRTTDPVERAELQILHDAQVDKYIDEKISMIDTGSNADLRAMRLNAIHGGYLHEEAHDIRKRPHYDELEEKMFSRSYIMQQFKWPYSRPYDGRSVPPNVIYGA